MVLEHCLRLLFKKKMEYKGNITGQNNILYEAVREVMAQIIICCGNIKHDLTEKAL